MGGRAMVRLALKVEESNPASHSLSQDIVLAITLPGWPTYANAVLLRTALTIKVFANLGVA